jgi:hypothetical protein
MPVTDRQEPPRAPYGPTSDATAQRTKWLRMRTYVLPWDDFVTTVAAANHLLLPLRFGIAMTAVIAFALIYPQQGIEALRVICEDRRILPIVLLMASVAFFGASSWAWARGLLFVMRPMHRAEQGTTAWTLGTWVPRALGVAPFLILAGALTRAAVATADAKARGLAVGLLIGCLALGAIALLLFRRAKYIDAELLTFESRRPGRNDPARLPRLTRGLALGALALWALGFLFMRQRMALGAVFFGAYTVVMLASVGWLAIGSWLVYVGSAKLRLPMLALLLLAALLWSGFDLNDNHAIRRTEAAVAGDTTPFNRVFSAWLAGRADRAKYASSPRGYPVFIVAAEGGGLRAAYYAAQVLASVQDACPAFAQHLLAISSVSGGSLGAAVFTALAKQRATNRSTNGCTTVATDVSSRVLVDSMLRRDFLSPVLASLFFADLAHRFLPWSAESADRARPLEIGWERAWARLGMPDNSFARPLHELWSPGFASSATPGLMLNTTHVESGRQRVLSNFTGFGNRASGLTGLAPATLDNVALSTATSMSARFPVVTPAAAIGDGDLKSRYVDGGYFENSGLATALDLVTLLPAMDSATGMRVWPIVIQIVSVDSATLSDRVRLTARSFGEVMSPIRTLLNTRQARGETASLQLYALGDAPPCEGSASGRIGQIRFVLRDAGTKVPLGWLLSDQSRATVRAQVDSVLREAAQPAACNQLNRIVTALEG